MNRKVRLCSLSVAAALCALAIATGALVPAIPAAGRSQCDLSRPAGNLFTGRAESLIPPLPSGILSEGESDEFTYLRLPKSLESSASGALFAKGARLTQCGSTVGRLSVQTPTDHGFSLVDQAVRLQI